MSQEMARGCSCTYNAIRRWKLTRRYHRQNVMFETAAALTLWQRSLAIQARRTPTTHVHVLRGTAVCGCDGYPPVPRGHLMCLPCPAGQSPGGAGDFIELIASRKGRDSSSLG